MPRWSVRAASMERSVGAALRESGLGNDGVGLVLTCLARAMEPRVAALEDDHHPAYLHPGRTLLILLRDAKVTEPAVLAGAAFIESEDAALRAPREACVAGFGAGAARIDAPGPGEHDVVERMLELPTDHAVAVLAERLDQVRHLHLRPDLAAVLEERLDEVVKVWGPLAERTSPMLARRFRHWARTFTRRLERDQRGSE